MKGTEMRNKSSRLQSLLLDAVEDYGYDFVDPYAADNSQCKYTYRHKDGEARHCIAGQVIINAGIDEERLEKAIDIQGNVTVSTIIQHLHNHGHTTGLSEVEIAQLSLCQMLQDRGFTWGQVLDICMESTSIVKNIDDATTLSAILNRVYAEGKQAAEKESNV